MSHIYCPECGFQNPEAANYCSKCGALLVKEEAGAETTMKWMADDGGDDEATPALEEFGVQGPALVVRSGDGSPEGVLEDLGIKGPALVVRSGGGRAGETFGAEAEQTTIGRSPDCGIFLDDVTVSRKHAVLTQRDGHWLVEDQGSLNGTFVNRKRVESAELEDGDELQIGKYRLTFLRH